MKKVFEKFLNKRKNKLKKEQDKFNALEAIINKLEKAGVPAPESIRNRPYDTNGMHASNLKINFLAQNRTEALLLLEELNKSFQGIDNVLWKIKNSGYTEIFPSNKNPPFKDMKKIDIFHPIAWYYFNSLNNAAFLDEFLFMNTLDKIKFEVRIVDVIFSIKNLIKTNNPIGYESQHCVFFDHPSKQNNLPISKALGI